MARTMTLEERLQRSRQVGAEATKPTTNQLAASTGVAPPNSAYGASLIPGVTSDQAKMMGTPAQKGAKIAAAQGETELEQATKLRAPTTASVLDVAKQRQAAAFAQSLGTVGDKATELVERTFQNIVGQGVQAAAGTAEKPATGMALQVDTAAKQLTGKTPEEIAAIAAIINNIATMPAGPDRNAETKKLNEKLGLTGENALTSEQVPALISKLPDTVAAAAAGQVKTTIGEKLTLDDLGQLGTTPGELASLLKVDEATIAEMTLPELQNRLAALGQTEFGETQAVTAGMVSGLLAPSQRAALRDVLVSLEERGVAGAEFQVAQIGKDIVDGTSVTIGGKEYTIEELLSTEEMTDIVTDVLSDPTSAFSKKLKESNPSFYNWIIASQDGLKRLLTEAGTGVGAFRTLQEKNLAKLKPLLAYKDYFNKMVDKDGKPLFDLTGLQAGELKTEDLPPAMQVVLNAPPEKQQTVLTALTQLPAGEVAALTPSEITALGLDNPTGLWSRYVAESASRQRIANIPSDQPQVIFDTLGWGSVDNATQLLADAILIESMGGPRHPILDVDVDDNGKIDAVDMENLKKLSTGGTLPSLKDIAKQGNVPISTLPDIKGTALDYGNDTTRTVMGMWKDGNISSEERGTLITDDTIDLSTLQSLFNREKASPTLRTSLEMAINSRVDRTTKNELKLRGYDYSSLLGSLGQDRPPSVSLDMGQSAAVLLDELANKEPNPQLRAEYTRKASSIRSRLAAKGR